jgi:adenine-specific DNA-methyltransferase
VKRYLDEKEGNYLGDLWVDDEVAPISANSSERWDFDTQKPEGLITRILKASSNGRGLVLDFFVGSGTTLAVAQKLGIKWIGIEIDDSFERKALPRMKEVLSGKGNHEPCGISKDINWSGGGFFKCQYLEQYEDALENIEIPQKTLEEFKDYFVKYMLEFESRDSKTFLNIDEMKDPFNYKLKIMDDYEPKTVSVDLVETYNYLIGLEVEKVGVVENKEAGKRRYVTVQGKREGRNVIVIWRNTKELKPEKDRDFIKANILKNRFDEVHINGDSLIEGAVLIEEQFKRIMNGG